MWDCLLILLLGFALVSEDSEVKEEMLSSNAVYSDCYPRWHLMNVYLCIPLYPSLTVEVYFCLYSLRTQVHSTSDFVQIHDLSFSSSTFLCCCCCLASAKIPITAARLLLSLSDTKTHMQTHTQIKTFCRHQTELIHNSNAGLVY